MQYNIKPHLREAGDLAALEGLAKGGRLAGLDPGKRRIGLALSDTSWRQALPHGVLSRSQLAADMQALGAWVQQWQIVGLVLGLPITMRGKEGRQAQSVRAFAETLHHHLALPLAFEDERLSTLTARKRLDELARPGHIKRAALDAEAAAVILQTALDRLAAGGN